MSADRFFELAPIAALGALDAADREDFEQHLPGCLECRGELLSHERVVGLIPLASLSQAPGSEARRRLLGGEPAARPGARFWLPLAAAAALVAGLGVSLRAARAAHDAALAELESARRETASLGEREDQARRELAVLRASRAQSLAVQALAMSPSARFVAMTAPADDPALRARVVWDPRQREALLLVTGLPRAPQGKAYQAWVIGEGAPVPAGLLHPNEAGEVVVRLGAPEEIGRARRFALSLEPEQGVPAPTGPILLAGGT